jgi:aminoglycoside 6'-N-acetyltransferase
MIEKSQLILPQRLETERLYIRPYQPGDEGWYHAMSQKNRGHLARYESDNPAMSINSTENAADLIRDLAAEWAARNCFFLGAFDKQTDAFIAQIYVGPVNWDLPEFQIGYFVDGDHEGQGYVTEAVQATLGFIFGHLHAHRVRLETDDTNVRSYQVAERCGMIREGHLRETKKNPDGTMSGTLFYGLLRSDFEARNNM